MAHVKLTSNYKSDHYYFYFRTLLKLNNLDESKYLTVQFWTSHRVIRWHKESK